MTSALPDTGTVRRALSLCAAATADQPVHVRAFVAWATAKADLAASLVTEISKAKGAQRNPTHAAVAGYAAAMSIDGATALFMEELDRLRRRTFFERKPYGHEIDGLVLLGVALGVRGIGVVDVREASENWLVGLVGRAVAAAPSGDWNATLIKAAGVVVDGRQWTFRDVAPEMATTLAVCDIIPFDAVPREAAWQVATDPDIPDDGPSRAAARLAAYDHLWRTAVTASLASLSVGDVAKILEKVSMSMYRWPWEDMPKTATSAVAKWAIENEYHVQSLLWAILAPLFPELRSEESTPSVGQKHPRVDIAIPGLEAVVEVKFVRKRDRFAEIVEQIAADASLYLQPESPYRHLVAFVWDDSARVEEHDVLRNGLLKIRGVRHAVVVSRPGRMQRN